MIFLTKTYPPLDTCFQQTSKSPLISSTSICSIKSFHKLKQSPNPMNKKVLGSHNNNIVEQIKGKAYGKKQHFSPNHKFHLVSSTITQAYRGSGGPYIICRKNILRSLIGQPKNFLTLAASSIRKVYAL